MKTLLILVVTVYGASALLSDEFSSSSWEHFKIAHQKNYVNAKEEAFRKQIFLKKLEKIQEHNKRYEQGLETYEVGVNQFTDMTAEEIRPYTHGLIEPKEITHKPLIKITSNGEKVQIPASFDWRDQGVVTPIKDQGSCGSCWAFSVTGAVESQERILRGANLDISISEQQLVDCDVANYGCNGGWMTEAFGYIQDNGGIDSEESYPYTAEDGNCHYRTDTVSAKLRGYAELETPDENKLADIVANIGPVSVAFDASGNFGSYKNGVYSNPDCSTNVFSHAVLIVGYGTENGQDYWLAKNSWGDWWGDKGYFKILRNANNHCGIAGKASYPVIY